MKNKGKSLKVMALSLIMAAFMTGCNCNNPDSNTSVNNEVKDNAIETIMTRTSIRSFTDRAVSADTVEMLLRDRAKIDELGGNGRQSQMWHESPLVIVVCGNMEKAMEGAGQAFWVQDCSAATENILLAAHALGLGAVWTGCYPIEERVANISQVLGLPEHIVPLCAIVMGFPNESPQPKDKWKPENVSYNGFE